MTTSILPTTDPNPTVNAPLILYGLFLESVLSGYVNLADDPIYGMLATVDYIPNQDTHQFKSSVNGETTGSGYYEGGQAVTGITYQYNVVAGSDGAADQRLLTLNGGGLVWPVATFDAAYLILYVNSPVAETLQPLIGYLDFDGTQSPADEAFYVNWNDSGIFTWLIPNAVT